MKLNDIFILFVSQQNVFGGQVWDVLSNKEVVSIVASAPRSCAARTLVESAVQAWRMKLPTAKVDDCSVVCLFFDSDSNFKSAYSIDDLASIEKSDIGSKVCAPKTLLHEVEQCPLEGNPEQKQH